MKLADQLEEIIFEGVGNRVVFLPENLENSFDRAVLLDKIPDSGAGFVETEIGSPLQVENHSFPVQFSEDRVLADPDAVCQADLARSSPQLHTCSPPCILNTLRGTMFQNWEQKPLLFSLLFQWLVKQFFPIWVRVLLWDSNTWVKGFGLVSEAHPAQGPAGPRTERTEAAAWARRPKTAQHLALRARIVLSCAEIADFFLHLEEEAKVRLLGFRIGSDLPIQSGFSDSQQMGCKHLVAVADRHCSQNGLVL